MLVALAVLPSVTGEYLPIFAIGPELKINVVQLIVNVTFAAIFGAVLPMCRASHNGYSF